MVKLLDFLVVNWEILPWDALAKSLGFESSDGSAEAYVRARLPMPLLLWIAYGMASLTQVSPPSSHTKH
jgi:hypothetical protein